METSLKRCTRCSIFKPFSSFSKSGRSKDGYNYYCKECCNEQHRAWEIRNPDYAKEYNIKNRDKMSVVHKKWLKDNHEACAKKEKEQKRLRRLTDPAFRIKCILRSRISKMVSRAVKKMGSGSKAGSAVRDCGCSIDFLKAYIEDLWTVGMSWETYGKDGWHVDHIVPLSSFDLTDREQFLKACHYTNLQPLWWFDNLAKRTIDNKIHPRLY